MATDRSAGTEIIRSAWFEIVDSTQTDLIVGVQHHIYTVLSVTVIPMAIQAAGNYISMFMRGYDAKEGTSQQNHYIFLQDMTLESTFVWNDKFSFNGHEPTDFVGPMDDATKQDAIADQGSGVAQLLRIISEHADDNFHVSITYIDQNNA